MARPLHGIMGQDCPSLGRQCSFLWSIKTREETELIRLQTGELKHELKGHTDFVKSLTVIPGSTPYLLTTSSDRSLRLWNLSSLLDGGSDAPRSALPVKEHSRPVDCCTWRIDEMGHLAIWTADSMGVIKEWEIVDGGLKLVKDIKGHETSVSCLHAVEDGLWSGTSSPLRLQLRSDENATGDSSDWDSVIGQDCPLSPLFTARTSGQINAETIPEDPHYPHPRGETVRTGRRRRRGFASVGRIGSTVRPAQTHLASRGPFGRDLINT